MVNEDTYEIYSQCLESAVDAYEHELGMMERVIEYYKRGKYPLPSGNQKRRIRRTNMILYITKDTTDPFDITYYISFNTRMSRFDTTFGTCMRANNIDFDMGRLVDKDLLFNDFAIAIKQKYNIRPVVTLGNKIVTFTFRFFIKTET